MSVLNDRSHNKKGYQDSVVGIFDFTKNTANHGNQHAQRLGENRMTLHEIERELTRLFPTTLTGLLEFLVASGTSMKDGRGKGRERVGNEILVLGRRLHEAEGVVREGSAAVRVLN
ncbi:hypothetical protein ACFX13_001649 [Malus domestica]